MNVTENGKAKVSPQSNSPSLGLISQNSTEVSDLTLSMGNSSTAAEKQSMLKDAAAA